MPMPICRLCLALVGIIIMLYSESLALTPAIKISVLCQIALFAWGIIVATSHRDRPSTGPVTPLPIPRDDLVLATKYLRKYSTGAKCSAPASPTSSSSGAAARGCGWGRGPSGRGCSGCRHNWPPLSPGAQRSYGVSVFRQEEVE